MPMKSETVNKNGEPMFLLFLLHFFFWNIHVYESKTLPRHYEYLFFKSFFSSRLTRLCKCINVQEIEILEMGTTFLVFYKFRSMTKEETMKANSEWSELRKSLPSSVELIGEYNHAWGTEYNGFLLFQADNSDAFLDWWSSFKDKIRWYVERTYTITARKR